MNLSDQERYFARSLAIGLTLALLLALIGLDASLVGDASARALIAFWLLVLGTAASLAYAPDYLHLTVNPEKAPRWEIKIRWRIAAALLLVGTLLSATNSQRLAALLAAAAFALVNYVVGRLHSPRRSGTIFFATDLLLMLAVVLTQRPQVLVVAGLLAASVHFCAVIERRPVAWAVIYAASGLPVLFLVSRAGESEDVRFCGALLVLLSAAGTVWMVTRAERRNARNISLGLAELAQFAGYSHDRIRHLWAVSNQELANNWAKAALPPNDYERLAEWYRENSELYLFALSAYDLDYKRMRATIGVLRAAPPSGRCLDYGAGDGALILELARRGHAAAYFDVDGATKRFAQFRARAAGLGVEFFHEKDSLTRSAADSPFAAIFALDVLEHMPDLESELAFLSGMLARGGLMIFDVPSGSTKNHPMHLDHHLDFRNYLASRGLQEERNLRWRLCSEEKYAFRAAGS